MGNEESFQFDSRKDAIRRILRYWSVLDQVIIAVPVAFDRVPVLDRHMQFFSDWFYDEIRGVP